MRKHDRKLDLAARAAWLYYAAGKRQDEIAEQLNVSRQAVQRLVALAVSEKLIKFRLDHPIAECMALARGAARAYGLAYCSVQPSDPAPAPERRHRDRGGRAPGHLPGRAGAADHRLLDRAHAAGGRRRDAGHGLPAAQAGLAGGDHLARRPGQLLRGREAVRRADRGAMLPDPDPGGRQQRRGAPAPADPALVRRGPRAGLARQAAFVGVGISVGRRRCTATTSSPTRRSPSWSRRVPSARSRAGPTTGPAELVESSVNERNAALPLTELRHTPDDRRQRWPGSGDRHQRRPARRPARRPDHRRTDSASAVAGTNQP